MLTKEYLQTLKPGTYAIFQDSVLFDMISVDSNGLNNSEQHPRHPISCVFGLEEGIITKWEQFFNEERLGKRSEYVIVPIENVNLHTGLTTGINEVRFQLCNK